MQELLIGAETLKAVSLGRPLDTVRCVENCTWHATDVSTPDFVE
jgi:hypothetical protein